MKYFYATIVCCALALTGARVDGQDLPQAQIVSEKVPDEVVASAVAAVSELGKAVTMGKYQVALERMNPKWKDRFATRNGGMAALERKLAAVADEMVKRGITILSSKPSGKPMAFGVAPKLQQVAAVGGSNSAVAVSERLAFSQWLVLVPTVSRYRILKPADDGGAAEWIDIESQSFQVAVSDRNKLEWTFIDGSGLSVNDLRSIYGTLPQDMNLPPVGKKQTNH